MARSIRIPGALDQHPVAGLEAGDEVEDRLVGVVEAGHPGQPVARATAAASRIPVPTVTSPATGRLPPTPGLPVSRLGLGPSSSMSPSTTQARPPGPASGRASRAARSDVGLALYVSSRTRTPRPPSRPADLDGGGPLEASATRSAGPPGEGPRWPPRRRSRRCGGRPTVGEPRRSPGPR